MIMLLAWAGVGLLIALWLLKQVDILWVVGMRRRLWQPLGLAGILTAVIAAYALATAILLWRLYAIAVRAGSTAAPTWVWVAGVVLGVAVAASLVATSRLNMQAWVRTESRGV